MSGEQEGESLLCARGRMPIACLEIETGWRCYHIARHERAGEDRGEDHGQERGQSPQLHGSVANIHPDAKTLYY